MKSKTLFLSLCALSVVTSTAFAAPQNDNVKIDYSIELRVDGERSLPAAHLSTMEGAPMFSRTQIGENPYKNEEAKEITFQVVPEVTEDGLRLVGSFKGVEGGEALALLPVDRIVKSGEVANFSFDMNGKVYEVLVKTRF